MSYLLIMLVSVSVTKKNALENKQNALPGNKTIPASIEKPVRVALSHYPQLKDTPIRFRFTRKLNKSIMAARPVIGSLLKNRKDRSYEILINPSFKLECYEEAVRHIPDSVMTGWIGHELGHIMDYERRTFWGLLGFGISYGFSKKYVRRSERVADSFAIDQGMGLYLLSTKRFILDHSELPQTYKDKIKALYLSPDDLVELVDALEKSDNNQRKDQILADEETAANQLDIKHRP